ncbi:reverse transcriptase domain-containing protein [Tanacetum coccineum]
MRFPDIPSTSIKLMLFPFSLEGLARIWLEKEPPRSILTWDDLVSKFINQFFPPSKISNLRNGITRFQQRFDESFYEAWDRFNDLLRACPHHGFLGLHQLDTFYNALNANDQDSLNSVAGSLPSNTVTNPKEDLKGITTRSDSPTTVVPVEKQNPVSEPDVAPHRENANEQKEKFYEIFKDMSFEISFMDALTLMPKFASTLKALIGNREKLSEMLGHFESTLLGGSYLTKYPEKLGDPGRFLIPSYEHYKGVVAEIEHSKPVIELQGAKMVETSPESGLSASNKSNRRRGLMIGVFRLKKILMRVEYPQELFSAVDLLSLHLVQMTPICCKFDTLTVQSLVMSGAFCTQWKVSMVSILGGYKFLQGFLSSYSAGGGIIITFSVFTEGVPVRLLALQWLQSMLPGSSGTKKYRGSNSSDGGNIGDGVKIAGGVIGSGDEIAAEANLGNNCYEEHYCYPKLMNHIRDIKEILGDITQRDIKEILGDITQRDIKEILGDITQRDIKEILGDITQRDIKKILGDITQRDIKEILGDITQRDISMLKVCLKSEMGHVYKLGRDVEKLLDVVYKLGSSFGEFQPTSWVVDFDQPRVPFNSLEGVFLRPNHALIDVYEGELTLRVDNEAITYNLDQTSRYSVNYNVYRLIESTLFELDCEEYSQGSSRIFRREADAFLALADGDRKINRKLMNLIMTQMETSYSRRLLTQSLGASALCAKKEGWDRMTNDENELYQLGLVTDGELCIDYHKLRKPTQKDHLARFAFMDQMLERLT